MTRTITLLVLVLFLGLVNAIKYLDTQTRNPSSSSQTDSGSDWVSRSNIQGNNDNAAWAYFNGGNSKILVTGGYGFSFPYPECEVETLETTLQVSTSSTFLAHRIDDWRLRRNTGPYSNNLGTPTFRGSQSTVTRSNTVSELGWNSLTEGQLSHAQFTMSWRHTDISNFPAFTSAHKASITTTFSLDVIIESVVPSSMHVNFDNWTQPSVTVTGRTFYDIAPPILCKFGTTEVTFGTLLNKTAIQCPLPKQNLYRPYPVAISLRNNLYTTENVAFTYICDPQSLCNGNGACNETGGCSCSYLWKGPTCSIRACGDGIVDSHEECDDSNNAANDGCVDCTITPGWQCTSAPSICNNCGNGMIEGTEQCDVGTTTNPGCVNCTINAGWVCLGAPSICSFCSNGVIEGNETCDDANLTPLDGCNENCRVETGWICTGTPSRCRRCGDGVLQFGEECDDSNTISGDGCSSTCMREPGYVCPSPGSRCLTVCGDAIIAGNETCDTGSIQSDGCVNCLVATGWICNGNPSICDTICGDGKVVGNEECDIGASTTEANVAGCRNCTITDSYACSGEPSVCNADCMNGVLGPEEECDDGNNVLGIYDGCTINCRIARGWVCNTTQNPSFCYQVCGNGIVTVNETCDTGNQTSDGCIGCQIVSGWRCAREPSLCFVCGNGILEYASLSLETCDDGNTVSGDGCSSNCTIEEGYSCTEMGNGTSFCSICGDGILDLYEACDDGNSVAGDGCDPDCRIERGWYCTVTSPSNCTGLCGDGNVTLGEECDDGNYNVSDGCVDCRITPGYVCSGSPSVCEERCPNFFVTPSEECDDGNTINGDGCDRFCKIEEGWNCTGSPSNCFPICGNGVLTGPQACDDGNQRNGDGCSQICIVENGWNCEGQPSVCTEKCGDNLVVGNEACDDGNLNNADGCNSFCEVENGWNCTGNPSKCTPFCGDGIRRGNEACDDGNQNNGDGCSSKCEVEVGYRCDNSQPSICSIRCGDSLIRSPETCDDGNTLGGDGCSSECIVEVGWTCAGEPSICVTRCGDGNVVSELEECDDGNVNIDDGCNGRCEVEPGWICSGSPSICLPLCGDGLIFGFEGCDDGNTRSGDGCNSNCQVENGWYCEERPSVCSTSCGDGLRAGDEGCDDGILDLENGCHSNCTVVEGWACTDSDNQTSVCHEVCGDGIVTRSEECDDGNILASDGCSNDCKIEVGFICTGTRPSICEMDEAFLKLNQKNDTGLVIAIILPIFFALFAAIGTAGFFLLRKRIIVLKRPDFAAIAFPPVAADLVSEEKRTLLDQLETLLLADDLVLVSNLCDITMITEFEKLAKSLVYIFYSKNRVVELLQHRIVKEIQLSDTQNTLFRSESMASKMFSVYCRIMGLEYLWDTLGLIMFELTKLGSKEQSKGGDRGSNSFTLLTTNLEVDPNKMEEGEDTLANTLQLQLYSHKLWKVIIDSEKQIPPDFRQIFATIANEVPSKFSDPKVVYKAVGGFFFLRFVCPCVTSPHVYGLIKEPPSELAQRHLVLLSKILQCIANGTLPGNKETFMQSMNGFIESHIEPGFEFFDRISTPTSYNKATEDAKYPLPDVLRLNSLSFIQKHLNLNYGKLAVALEGHPNGKQIKDSLDRIMQNIAQCEQ